MSPYWLTGCLTAVTLFSIPAQSHASINWAGTLMTPVTAAPQYCSGAFRYAARDGNDDIAKLSRDLFVGSGKDPVASVAQFNTRIAPAGTRWHYASVETEILGLVLRAATGGPVADYLHDRIWQAIGTEADASWAIDGTGQEITYCCFNAVLRDYARFGRLLAHDGAWNGRQLIPRSWVIDATTVAAPFLAPGKPVPNVPDFDLGYGFPNRKAIVCRITAARFVRWISGCV